MARVRMTADRKRLYEIIEEFFVTGQLEAMIAPCIQAGARGCCFRAKRV